MDFNSILLGPRPDGDFFGGLDLTELANASSKSTRQKIATFVGVTYRESLLYSQLYLCHTKIRYQIMKSLYLMKLIFNEFEYVQIL